MRVWLPRGISRRMSSTGGWFRRPGAAGLGGAGARPPAGLIRSSAVLGHTVGAWVSVGLLLGLVVIHPVRERRACCWCRPGHQGPVKEDHVL